MFLVAGSGGMLSRKPSPWFSTASSSNSSAEDNHTTSSHSHSRDIDDDSTSSCRTRINEALSSLGSSSVALHHQGITSVMPPPTLHSAMVAQLHSANGCRSSQNARTRLMLIDSMFSSSAASDLASTSAVRLDLYQEVLDIQKWVMLFNI